MTEVIEQTSVPPTAQVAAEVSEQDQRIFEQVKTAVACAHEKKANEPVVLRLTALTEFTDYFVICSGSNTRQVQAIADEVALQLKKQYRLRPLNTEGYNKAEWILIDFGAFVFHAFIEDARRFYDLERLWRDAERVDV